MCNNNGSGFPACLTRLPCVSDRTVACRTGEKVHLTVQTVHRTGLSASPDVHTCSSMIFLSFFSLFLPPFLTIFALKMPTTRAPAYIYI